jgi:hypothetical protein
VRSRVGRTGTLFAFALLSACRGDDNAPPVAEAADFRSFEDQPIVGQLTGSDPEGQALTFAVVSTSRGDVTSLSNDGAFRFEPEADFYGTASFAFSVTDDHGLTDTATVSIEVENVNDAPRLAAIPDLTNSPETEALLYELVVVDLDPDDVHSFSIAAADPTIVEASIDEQRSAMVLKGLRLGSTSIEVRVSDAEYSDATEFTFSMEEVTKGRVFRYADTATGAVVLRNETDRPIDFVLEHNGFPVFEDVESMAEYVRAMPGQFENEDFPRKLWRFLRDSVYHDVPLNANRVHYDPWVTLNSLGWGFCGNIAGAYVVIAQAAGYEARVWGLNGHVVPEIKFNGQWQMYDPDLAVYYKTADGRVAGVEELAASPSLITAPIDPIFAGSWYQFPYSQTIADFYSTAYNNFDGVDTFLPANDTPSARIVLPPAATLTYPGHWTDVPLGYDGTIPYEIQAYRQALIELPTGWTGEVRLPWMAWEIAGDGLVGIDDEVFTVGSPELTTRLRDTEAPVTSMQIYSSGEIRIVLFVNAIRFDIHARTIVAIRGLDVWGIDVSATKLDQDVSAGSSIESWLLKPLPTTLR